MAIISQQLTYVVFRTCAGPVGLVASPAGIVRLALPSEFPSSAANSLAVPGLPTTTAPLPAPEDSPLFQGLVPMLVRYFAGERMAFDEVLDIAGATPFEQRVWRAARTVPYGETRSYAWLAREIGQPRATRAVGHALGRNPIPIIIPCHRFVRSDGALGGLSAGLDMKVWLLRLEGVLPAG